MNVTINSTTDTPSQEAVRPATTEAIVRDARGRSITLKRPGVLSQYRLVDMLGVSAKNDVYMSMVLPVTFVTAIDGEDVRAPLNRLELEAIIQRLDEDGISAVMQGVQDNFNPAGTEKTKEQLGN